MKIIAILVEFLFFLNYLLGYQFQYFFPLYKFKINFIVERNLSFPNPVIIITVLLIFLLSLKDLLRLQFHYFYFL